MVEAKNTDRGPGRRPGLDRRTVLARALELVDAEGLEALSIRKLAAALGVDAMTIYRFVDSKQALLDGLLDLLYEDLHVSAEDPDWRGQLHRLADAFRSAVLNHPQLLPVVAGRPLVTPLARRPPSSLRVTEELIALFERAGMDQDTAVRCYRWYTSWLIGHTMTEARALVDNNEETEPMLRLSLHELPPQQYPGVRALALSLHDHDTPTELHSGLDALLDALGTA